MKAWIVLAAVLAAAIGTGLYPLRPPAPDRKPAGTGFSTSHAFKHVQAIAREPHPIGSSAHDEVLRYVTLQFQALRLHVELLPAVDAGRPLTNLLARMPARGDTARTNPDIVLLVTHYDSVPAGPGAADCAAGVATLLETARALTADPVLTHEVAFLVTDGEEAGLLGAKALVSARPAWLDRVRVVLNFEARGQRGPVVMFETGTNQLGLIRALARTPHPIAASFASDIYRYLPNDTDFTVFRRAGFDGLNFAVIAGLEAYHTPQDSPANLSQRSLAHYGTYALGLARDLANADLAQLKEPRAAGSAVYFPLWRGALAVYPSTWTRPLSLLALLLLAAAFTRHYRARSRTATLPQVLGGMALAGALLITMPVLAWVALRGLKGTLGFTARGFLWPGFPHAGLVLAGLLAATTLVVLAAKAAVRRWISPESQLLGALVGAVTLAVITGFRLPAWSFLFVWPALASSASLLSSRAPAGRCGLRPAVAMALSAAGVWLFSPVILLLYYGVTLGMAPVFVGVATYALLHLQIPQRAAPSRTPAPTVLSTEG